MNLFHKINMGLLAPIIGVDEYPGAPRSAQEMEPDLVETTSCVGESIRDNDKPAALDPTVGGQAVLEGIMMRNQGVYSLAVRLPDQQIGCETGQWYSLSNKQLLKKKWLRGFPILVETMINGVKTLNRSALLTDPGEEEPITKAQLTMTLVLAVIMAAGLFVVLPHLLSLGMKALGLGGDVDGFTFHLWDGLFKFAIFMGYIALIALMPEIKRVFQYHGAEHQTIAAFESGQPVNSANAALRSRLHPRCGTTFMLVVLCLAILIHTIALPPIARLWQPESALIKHSVLILVKILLMIPIAAISYEFIRFAAKLPGIWGKILRAPGMGLQLLTTRKPNREQLDVAVVALYEALGPAYAGRFETPAYRVLPADGKLED